MIEYVEDLVKELQERGYSENTKIKIDGVFEISKIILGANSLHILTDDYDNRQTAEEEIAELEDKISECQDVLSTLYDNFQERNMEDSLNDYAIDHPEIWEILKKIPREDLRDFVKYIVDWDSVEYDVNCLS